MDDVTPPSQHPADPAPAPDVDSWRIDDLAQRAGVAVDTIRYYQREGLLPSCTRVGRTVRFSQEHLDRLERIKSLQGRRFSLAAIRALVNHDGGIGDLLDGRDGEVYDHDALIEAAGVSVDLVRGLEKAGVLRSPEEYGRAGYDAEDVGVLEAFGDIATLGAPHEVLDELADVFARGITRIQDEIAQFFTSADIADWPDDAFARFDANTRQEPRRLVDDLRVISAYLQHRTIQRAVMRALESEASERPSD